MDIAKLWTMGAKRVVFTKRDARVFLPTTIQGGVVDFNLASAISIMTEMALGGYVSPVVRLDNEKISLVFTPQNT